MRWVCVYCGSSAGSDPAYARAAAELGATLAREGLDLVYGGGSVGLMGVLADAALAAGGRVVGVLPRGLFSREAEHRGLTELHEVSTMHERKRLMVDLADAFVALPGGLGTLEELAEVTTWAQLGIHAKPIAVLDVNGYWAPLLQLLDDAVNQGFLAAASRRLVIRVTAVSDLLPALAAYMPPPPDASDHTADEL